MTVYTNMAWPDDPYGTGQLWRKEPPLLASFAALCVDDDERAIPVAYAVVYLRVHRTTPIEASSNLAFGFRAVSNTAPQDLAELVRLFDLDAMRARRLATIVAGHHLADDLHAMETATEHPDIGRGIRALAADWGTGNGTHGMALMFDTADDLPDAHELADAAHAAGIDTETVQRAFQPQHTIDVLFECARDTLAPGSSPPLITDQPTMRTRAGEWLGACATERALISALIAARHLDRYTWDGTFDIAAVLAANVWDCFPTQDFTSRQPT